MVRASFRKKPQKIAVLFLLVLIIVVGLLLWHSKADKKACSQGRGICLAYPANWKRDKLFNTEGYPANARGFTLLGPSGKTHIEYSETTYYSNDDSDLCMESSRCFFTATSISPVDKIDFLRIVSGVAEYPGGPVIGPMIAVMDIGNLNSYGLVVGKTMRINKIIQPSFVLDINGQAKREVLIAVSEPMAGYKSLEDAQKWLARPEVKQAKKIMKSLSLKP